MAAAGWLAGCWLAGCWLAGWLLAGCWLANPFSSVTTKHNFANPYISFGHSVDTSRSLHQTCNVHSPQD